MTVVNTPGFGDQLDNRQCCQPIAAFLEEQFQRFLQADTSVHRDNIQDTRVHACLYFIAPSGHGLKNIDVQFMKNLQHKVNLVPVIGKSDAFTNEEIVEFKEKIQGSPSHLLLLSQIKFSRELRI